MIMKPLKDLSTGGFHSSALAMMLVNYEEHLALSLQSNSMICSQSGLRIIDGLRITDDGLIIIVLSRTLHLTTVQFIPKVIYTRI